MAEDFEEIGHSGGQVTFTVVTEEGQCKFQVGLSFWPKSEVNPR